MALWDFVKDAGKSIFGSEAHAAEAKAAPAPAAPGAAQPAHDEDTQRKVAALEKELKELNLQAKDVKIRLRGDTVIIENKGTVDRETMEKLILAVGNIKGIASVEAELPPAAAAAAGAAATKDSVFHTVQSGETLSAIAKKYLGDANAYNKIFEANKPMLTSPDKIYPGQKLRIPQA